MRENQQSEIEKWAKNQNEANVAGGIYLLSVVIVWACSGSFWLGAFWPFMLIGRLI